jgi:hypothetical protein
MHMLFSGEPLHERLAATELGVKLSGSLMLFAVAMCARQGTAAVLSVLDAIHDQWSWMST